jgi:hypothetical protein
MFHHEVMLAACCAATCRLQIWRLARHIISRPPGISQRISMGPAFLAGRTYASAVYNAGHMPPVPSWKDPQVAARWASRPLPSLLGYIVDQGAPPFPASGTLSGPTAAALALCDEFEAQEQSLLWCVLRYARLVTGTQLERDLSSLLTAEQRSLLGQLPVFVMGLGQQLKEQAQRVRLMWAYASFKSTTVSGRQAGGGKGRRARLCLQQHGVMCWCAWQASKLADQGLQAADSLLYEPCWRSRRCCCLYAVPAALPLQVSNSKVRRYITRNAHDQASLQRYLVKFTVSELQALKAECLPWWGWDMGQKAQQAAELAEWLWWLTTTWLRMRAVAGLPGEAVL